MNVEIVIEQLEEEIRQLVMDMSHVVNDASVRALQNAVSNCEDRIVELKEKYLSKNEA